MQRDVHDFLSVAVYDFLFQKFRMLVCKSGRHIIILAGCHARSLSVDQISASWFSNSYSYYYYKFKLFSSKPLDPLHIMHAKLHKKKVIERWIFDGFFFDDAELVIISVADFFLKTHDFLPQVEKRADQTPPPPPPPPPHAAVTAEKQLLHQHALAAAGAFTINHAVAAAATAVKQEPPFAPWCQPVAAVDPRGTPVLSSLAPSIAIVVSRAARVAVPAGGWARRAPPPPRARRGAFLLLRWLGRRRRRRAASTSTHARDARSWWPPADTRRR